MYEDSVFQPLREAARITGLSESFLRKGCQVGAVPHIRVGIDYRVNITRLLEVLDELSMRRS